MCIICGSKREKRMQDIWVFLQHHLLMTIASVIILLLLIIVEFLKNRKATTDLSPLEAIQLINHENATIVDIRSSDAYASGHILGSISIPSRDLNDKIKKIEKFKVQPVILVCAMGKESHQAMQTLTNKGFTRVYSLHGGIQTWKTNEMPLTKG
jgi:rhodanese-related sulfurtransferase